MFEKGQLVRCVSRTFQCMGIEREYDGKSVSHKPLQLNAIYTVRKIIFTPSIELEGMHFDALEAILLEEVTNNISEMGEEYSYQSRCFKPIEDTLSTENIESNIKEPLEN